MNERNKHTSGSDGIIHSHTAAVSQGRSSDDTNVINVINDSEFHLLHNILLPAVTVKVLQYQYQCSSEVKNASVSSAVCSQVYISNSTRVT